MLKSHTAFLELSSAAEVRVIVLAANGAALFAGGDLNWMKAMADYTPEQNRADAAQLATMLRTIYQCPKPVIAKVQGDHIQSGLCRGDVASVSAGNNI